MSQVRNKDVPTKCLSQKDTVPGWYIKKCIRNRGFMGKVAFKIGFRKSEQFGKENILTG